LFIKGSKGADHPPQYYSCWKTGAHEYNPEENATNSPTIWHQLEEKLTEKEALRVRAVAAPGTP
jgi:hypothetical protein